MAAFPKAVEFQHLANQLNDTEFEMLLLDLMHSMGRDFILNAFFCKFTMQKNTEKEYGEIDFMNKLILYIMATRNEKNISLDPIPNEDDICLDELSSTLIGEISSFLHVSDYTSFDQCNRLIYIGCNMPNTLRTLDLTKYDDCSNIDLNRYAFLESLSFPFGKFYQFPSLLDVTFHHLESLTLCAHYLDKIDGDNILLFLSKCPNLKELKLSDVYVRDQHFDANGIIALPDNIRSLSIYGNETCFGEFYSFLIDAFGDQLTELAFDGGFEISDNVKFLELKCWQIGIDDSFNALKNVDKIFESARNLERFVCDFANIGEFDYDQFFGTIVEKNSLKEVDIGTFDIDKLCDGLGVALSDITYDSDDEVMHNMPTSMGGEIECKQKSKKTPKICIVYKWKRIRNERIGLDEYDMNLRLGIVKILKLIDRLEEELRIRVYWDPDYKACFDTFEKTFADYLNHTRLSYNQRCLSFYK